MEKYKKIFIVGDLHGNYNPILDCLDNIEKDSLIIQVGDCGVGFRLNHIQRMILIEIQKQLKEKNSKLYIIRGNHDNPSIFPNQIDNIYHLNDYTYKEINGLKWLFVGGATSIDRYSRTENHNWWKDEIVVYNPDKCKEKCDVLITHTSGVRCSPHDSDEELKKIISLYVPDLGNHQDIMFNDLKNERQKIEKILIKTQPKFHYYGHYHFSKYEIIDGCHTYLLNINEIKQFKEF